MQYVDLRESNDTKRLKEARSIRLKLLRRLVGLSRRSLALQFSLKEATLQNWEAPRHGGLTESGAQKIIESYCDLGLYVDLNWLMYGQGDTPKLQGQSDKSQARAPTRSTVKDEIQHMKQLYPHSLLYKVPDNTMEPQYPTGTFVIGAKVPGHEVSKFHNKICVCLTENGETVLRLVKVTRDADRYDLISLNPSTSVRHACLYSRKLTAIAPVFWARFPNIA